MTAKKKPAPTVLYPDSLRATPTLPAADSVLNMGFGLTEEERTVVRMAMAIHSASRRPALTWTGWRHVAVALAIGTDHARKAAGGRNDTPDYRAVMGEFLRKTGLIFLNKDDRACAVRLLPRWDEIDEWRESLDKQRHAALNNPREVWAAFVEARRELGDPEAHRRPGKRKQRQYPSLLEQFEALEEQLQMAQERAERAEREAEYFAEMADAIAAKAKLDDGAVAEIRAKVRDQRTIPNAETVAALEEAERGGGKVYRGTGRQIVDAIVREGGR